MVFVIACVILGTGLVLILGALTHMRRAPSDTTE